MPTTGQFRGTLPVDHVDNEASDLAPSTGADTAIRRTVGASRPVRVQQPCGYLGVVGACRHEEVRLLAAWPCARSADHLVQNLGMGGAQSQPGHGGLAA